MVHFGEAQRRGPSDILPIMKELRQSGTDPALAQRSRQEIYGAGDFMGGKAADAVGKQSGFSRRPVLRVTSSEVDTISLKSMFASSLQCVA